MKEINISDKLIAKRKEKGITQDDLAVYIGVSKSSVSKWETGQSYPDITFLPQLATYFNISIDELMSYSPQMTSEDINNLYHKLSDDFNKQNFDTVLTECHHIIKKYYSCFPLILKMATLLLNHYMLASEKKTQNDIIQEVIDLCIRIKNESGDSKLFNEANSIHSVCLLIQNKPSEVIELLDCGYYTFVQENNTLLASAYMSIGNIERTKEILQSNIYENVLSILNSAPMLISINSTMPEKANDIINKMFILADIFNIEKLHPNTILSLYLSTAQYYSTNGDVSKTLEYLKKYTDTCCLTKYPIKLHGDDFFDSIDKWFQNLNISTAEPRGENIIKESLLRGILDNPSFILLHDNPQYKKIVKRFKENIGGN